MKRIQKLANADIFRVETVKNYPDNYIQLQMDSQFRKEF